MAARKFTHRGLTVEVWEQSFRVDGMARTMHIGSGMTDEAICQMIDAIYAHVAEQAENEAKLKVSAKMKNWVNKMVFDD